jgi:hypothetical protein
VPGWHGNPSHEGFVAFGWDGPAGEQLLVVVVNQAAHRGQCFVRLPATGLAGRTWQLRDRLGEAVYERDGGALQEDGLFVDAQGFEPAAFSLEPLG